MSDWLSTAAGGGEPRCHSLPSPMSSPQLLTLSRALALSAAALWGGCASQPPGPPIPVIAEEINATRSQALLGTLAPGDTLEVSFDQRSDWNHNVRIRPDGQASFRSVGDLEAVGLSIPQLREKLTARYAEIFQSPVVTVNVSTPADRTVIVTGEVNSPGQVALGTGRLTLVQALALAGGHKTSSARLDNTLLMRWMPEDGRRIAWRIDAGTDHWGTPDPILLQPYDVIYVPDTPVTKVNIWVDRYIRQMIPIPNLFPGVSGISGSR